MGRPCVPGQPNLYASPSADPVSLGTILLSISIAISEGLSFIVSGTPSILMLHLRSALSSCAHILTRSFTFLSKSRSLLSYSSILYFSFPEPAVYQHSANQRYPFAEIVKMSAWVSAHVSLRLFKLRAWSERALFIGSSILSTFPCLTHIMWC